MNGRILVPGKSATTYAANLDHVLAHVEVLSLRLAKEVSRRKIRDGADEDFKGLFV
ncbi:MAG: hypothetical protein IIC21_02970, partial [Chloroflexi bacterium]|nr:hypothetical protein [Chloroflexota bacterium]